MLFFVFPGLEDGLRYCLNINLFFAFSRLETVLRDWCNINTILSRKYCEPEIHTKIEANTSESSIVNIDSGMLFFAFSGLKNRLAVLS